MRSVMFNHLTAILIIVEVCSLCLSEPEKSKLDLIAPDQSPALDLIKKPISQFFSKVDKFFSDFIENKLPYFDERPRVSLANSLPNIGSNDFKGKSPGEMYDKLDNTLTHIKNGNGLDLANVLNPPSATIVDKHTNKPEKNEYDVPRAALRTLKRKRSVGNRAAKDEDYSFVVRIYKNGVDFMTGVYLAEDLVATSASGLFDQKGHMMNPKDLTIKKYEHHGEKERSEYKVQEFQVKDLLPEFQNSSISNYSTHDIALLRTEGSTKLVNYPYMASKPLTGSATSSIPVQCFVVTWMKPPHDSTPSKANYELKNIIVNLSEKSRCKKEIDQFNEQTEYCALGLRSGADRGSPLFCSGKLTGLVSHSAENNDVMPFDVYTKIYAFSDFIQKAKMKSLMPANQHDLAKQIAYSQIDKPVIFNSLIMICSFLSIADHFLMNYH